MSAEIHNLNDIKPKQVIKSYKRVPIKLTFIPSTKQWKWEITIITETKYSELSDSEARALRDAHKYIDKHELGKD